MRDEQKPLQLSPEIILFFQNFIRALTSTVRAIVQAVTKHLPELQAIVQRHAAHSKRIKRLTYRKKKSQAKNWHKWRKRRRRRS